MPKIGEAVEAANEDDSIRVVILRGEGERAFGSGADISEFGTKHSDPEQVALYTQAVDHVQSALKVCKRPTVAVIRGICMGGGMGLALSCDLRYAAIESKFRMPAGKLDLGYARNGVKRFANMVGYARTADLFLTARIFYGAEAARIGMVHRPSPRSPSTKRSRSASPRSPPTRLWRFRRSRRPCAI